MHVIDWSHLFIVYLLGPVSIDGLFAFISPTNICVFFTFLTTSKQISFIFRKHVNLFLSFQVLNGRFLFQKMHKFILAIHARLDILKLQRVLAIHVFLPISDFFFYCQAPGLVLLWVSELLQVKISGEFGLRFSNFLFPIFCSESNDTFSAFVFIFLAAVLGNLFFHI